MPNELPSGRDTRIDVFRGLVLISVFLTHVPGTIYEHLSHRNFGFSDSAEAFVLISGISAGLAYKRFGSGRRMAMSVKAWKRAGSLYVAHVATTLLSLAIFAAAAIFFRDFALLRQNNIDFIVDDTPYALVGLATLGHQIGYNNILSLYFVLMLLLPLMLLAAEQSLLLLVGASGLLWLVAGIWGIAPHNYPTPGVWFLNPLSWQFLFAIGLAGALHATRSGRLAVKPWLAALAFSYLLVALLWVRVPFWGVDTSLGMPAVVTGFDKTFLSLPRLLHVLAIAATLIFLPTVSRWATVSTRHPLAILGRHSLSVFILGTLLAMLAQAWKAVEPPHFLTDTLLVIGGLLMQFALAYGVEWLRKVEAAGRGAGAQQAEKAQPRRAFTPDAAAPA